MRPFGFFSTLAPAGASILATYQIDFGDDIGGRLSPAPWNNFDDGSVGFVNGSSLANITDTDSNVSGIEVVITDSFSAVNGAGAADDPVNSPYPFSATRDGFEITQGSVATIEFRNLDPTKVYDFTIFGARAFIGDSTDYTALGFNSRTETLNINNNGNGQAYLTVTISDIIPDMAGTIALEVEGNGGNGYINVVELIEKNP